MFHIHPLMDECWSNEIYKCVYVYVHPRNTTSLEHFERCHATNPFTSPAGYPYTLSSLVQLMTKKQRTGRGRGGNLPTRTIRRNLLYCHKQHQWNEAVVSISGKWKAVGGLRGTVEADITCNKSSEGHTYMHLCLHLLLNGLHSNT